MTKVLIVEEAQEQARFHDAWWATNRLSAPALFAHELAGALHLLTTAPEIGQRFHRSTVPGVRRLVLQKTRNLVYYVFDRASDTVWVLSIWGAPKQGDPPLREPK